MSGVVTLINKGVMTTIDDRVSNVLKDILSSGPMPNPEWVGILKTVNA